MKRVFLSLPRNHHPSAVCLTYTSPQHNIYAGSTRFTQGSTSAGLTVGSRLSRLFCPVYWVMEPCGYVLYCRSFGGPYLLHLQGHCLGIPLSIAYISGSSSEAIVDVDLVSVLVLSHLRINYNYLITLIPFSLFPLLWNNERRIMRWPSCMCVGTCPLTPESRNLGARKYLSLCLYVYPSLSLLATAL
jgi:hypothetical protein